MKELIKEVFPIIPLPEERDVMVKVCEVREAIARDQTRKFPIASRRGAKYIMVMCEVDENAI